jgi:hypothetical protein
MLMINKPKDITTFAALKKVIPDLEYHLTVNDKGEVDLLSRITDDRLRVLRNANYTIKGINLIDRVKDNNFSFTGLPCHIMPAINIAEGGAVFHCPNSYHQFYTTTGMEPSVPSLLDISNKEAEEIGKPAASCPFTECNVCNTDIIGAH